MSREKKLHAFQMLWGMLTHFELKGQQPCRIDAIQNI